VAVGPGCAGAGLVEGLEGAGEEENRDLAQLGVALHRLADLVAVPPRHDHVGEDDVGAELARAADRVLAVVHRDDLEVLAREGDAHDLLDGDRVVSEEQGLGHEESGPSLRRGP
jgi:hypothetical protein